MARPKRDTTNFKGRIDVESNEKLASMAEKFGFKGQNKSGVPEIGMLLLLEGLSLLTNPDQCPPLSPEFMRLRTVLHGQHSGSYADEPGRPASGPTVVGNMQANAHMAETLNTLASLLVAKDAEIASLRSLVFPHEKKDHHAQNGGVAA